jgi:type I restriction enzyme M protein
MALEHVWNKMEALAKEKGWSPVQIERKKRDVASKCFRGLDKDSFLAKVTKAYMAIIGDGRGGYSVRTACNLPLNGKRQRPAP